jgi:hypothetical protein
MFTVGHQYEIFFTGKSKSTKLRYGEEIVIVHVSRLKQQKNWFFFGKFFLLC